MSKIEVKRAAGAAEFKTADDMAFSGYGAYFGNEDAHGDVIKSGAFKRTIAEAKSSGVWPAMLLQHGAWGAGSEDMTPIGVWTDMYEDDKGLVVAGKLAPTPRGQEVYTLMKMTPRPAIDGLSIGYRAKKFTMGTKPNEPYRWLEDVDLVEVSCVTFPANGKSRVDSVKTEDGERPTIRDAEGALREAGFSRQEAKAIVAGGFKTLTPRDAGDGADDIATMLKRNIAIITT
jgi:uncharacterized protein